MSVVLEKYLKTDDLVENIIIKKLLQLKEQNRNLVNQIEGTRAALKIKDIKEWKATDYYNYFCNKYTAYYKEEYRVVGKVSITIKKIDEFIVKMGISKEDYKLFIDLAFSRYFNKTIRATVGHIVSDALYMKLTGRIRLNIQNYTSNNYKIENDVHKFEEDVKNIGVFFAKK